MARVTETTRRILEAALNEWENVYQPLNIVPTVRTIFYRLSTLGIVEKSQPGYDRVQYALARARERGDYPWDGIYDGLRELQRASTWKDLAGYYEACRNSYSRDKWQDQPRLVEVWLEKHTLQGTLQSVIDEFEVPLLIDRGYLSVTAKKDAALRLRSKPRSVVYIGDFDPSGLNMLVEAEEWIAQMAGEGVDIDIQRIAVTEEDHANPDIPHLDVNRKDSRTPDYIERYGEEVVEVEAIAPEDLQARLRKALASYRDDEAWAVSLEKQAVETKRLRRFLKKAK
jgi:hypothetical protein